MRNLFLTVLILFSSLNMIAQELPLISLFPPPGLGNDLEIAENPSVYAGDELYDLIDGGADVYFEYGFDEVISGQLKDSANNVIQIEIYKMKDAPAAYGIFSLNNANAQLSDRFGHQSNINESYISFWKNNYYVNISWTSKRSENVNEMASLAAYIDKNIQGSGNMPEIAIKPFKEGALQNLVYFRGNTGLSNFYYFTYKNIFDFDDGIYLKYPDYQLLLLEYSDNTRSRGSFDHATESLKNIKKFTDFEAFKKGITFRDQKGNHLLCRYTGDYILILISPEDGTFLHSKSDEILPDLYGD